MKFSIMDFFSKCDQIRSFLTFTEEILNRKLHFFWSDLIACKIAFSDISTCCEKSYGLLPDELRAVSSAQLRCYTEHQQGDN